MHRYFLMWFHFYNVLQTKQKGTSSVEYTECKVGGVSKTFAEMVCVVEGVSP